MVAGEYLLRGGQIAGHLSPTASAIYGKSQFLHVKRLFKEINRAVLKKFERRLRMLYPSKTDNRKREWKVGSSAQQVTV